MTGAFEREVTIMACPFVEDGSTLPDNAMTETEIPDTFQGVISGYVTINYEARVTVIAEPEMTAHTIAVPPEVYMSLIIVEPAHRGKGYFRQFCEHFLEKGYTVKIPCPLGRMRGIVKRAGYTKTTEHNSRHNEDVDVFMMTAYMWAKSKGIAEIDIDLTRRGFDGIPLYYSMPSNRKKAQQCHESERYKNTPLAIRAGSDSRYVVCDYNNAFLIWGRFANIQRAERYADYVIEKYGKQ